MTKFIALGRTADGRLFPLAVDAYGRLVIAATGTSAFVNITVTNDADINNLLADTAYFGDVAGGDYTYIEVDGTIQSFGDGTCWRDELQPLTSLRITSPSNDFILNDAEVSLTCKNSARYPTDFVYTNIQLNHDWVLGTALHPHLHWWQAQAATPNWLIAYRWQKQGSAKTTSWTLQEWTSNSFAYTVGTINQITEFSTITPPVGYGQVSDIVQFKFYRDFTNVSTKFTGSDPVASDVEAVQFDIHMQVDMFGSHQEYVK